MNITPFRYLKINAKTFNARKGSEKQKAIEKKILGKKRAKKEQQQRQQSSRRESRGGAGECAKKTHIA